MMSVFKSITLSLVASAAATYLLRQILSASTPPGGDGSRRPPPYSSVVVIVPVFTGNSDNHVFHIERRRGLFPR
jgi:hypothetical protein